MQTVMNLGQLNYLISQLALISRQFEISYINGMGEIYTIDRFISIINQTQIQQANILTDYSSWSYCPSSNAINNDVIPYVTYEHPSITLYTNLYGFTEKMIANVINYLV